MSKAKNPNRARAKREGMNIISNALNETLFVLEKKDTRENEHRSMLTTHKVHTHPKVSEEELIFAN